MTDDSTGVCVCGHLLSEHGARSFCVCCDCCDFMDESDRFDQTVSMSADDDYVPVAHASSRSRHAHLTQVRGGWEVKYRIGVDDDSELGGWVAVGDGSVTSAGAQTAWLAALTSLSRLDR